MAVPSRPEQARAQAHSSQAVRAEAARAPAERAGYLGPEGTFTEEALLSSAQPGAVQPVAFETIYDTVMGLARGEVEWALVPIENSLDGSVTVTLDLLVEQAHELEVVGEALLGVRHSLVAGGAIELAEIQTVLSHPQVPGQCSHFLRGELAHARVLPASSTAEAVRLVSGGGMPGHAALGTRLAAEIYGGTVIREGVQDRDDNETRFVWLGRRGAFERSRLPLRVLDDAAPTASKTSIVFWGPGADHAGWLVRCLDEFARRQINLTKIESRPTRERMGHYMFFVDLEGDLNEGALGGAMAGLAERCQEVRVLGSYRSAPQRYTPRSRDG
jgi:prephenate dehydratase